MITIITVKEDYSRTYFAFFSLQREDYEAKKAEVLKKVERWKMFSHTPVRVSEDNWDTDKIIVRRTLDESHQWWWDTSASVGEEDLDFQCLDPYLGVNKPSRWDLVVEPRDVTVSYFKNYD